MRRNLICIAGAYALTAALMLCMPTEAQRFSARTVREVRIPEAAPCLTSDGTLEPLPDCAVLRFLRGEEVCEIALEDYVLGVVLAEMPVSFGSEALTAQAVAARTYACYRLAHGMTHGDSGCAVCDDYTCCCGYIAPGEAARRWGTEETDAVLTAVREAVQRSRGQILLYDGEPALTVWHSGSYQTTLGAEAVWGQAIPYLIPVDTPEEDRITETDIPAAVLADKGMTEWDTVSPTEVRARLGLPSARFETVPTEDGVRFICHGYGHGVGLSQYGAAAMGAEGADYTRILSHYYPGTEIGRSFSALP